MGTVVSLFLPAKERLCGIYKVRRTLGSFFDIFVVWFLVQCKIAPSGYFVSQRQNYSLRT